jgi:hypothetical protein
VITPTENVVGIAAEVLLCPAKEMVERVVHFLLGDALIAVLIDVPTDMPSMLSFSRDTAKIHALVRADKAIIQCKIG